MHTLGLFILNICMNCKKDENCLKKAFLAVFQAIK
jgi:hypothetical protein